MTQKSVQPPISESENCVKNELIQEPIIIEIGQPPLIEFLIEEVKQDDLVA